MGVESVIATQVIDTTTVGRAVMTAADAAAVRTAISFDESVDDRVAALLVAGTNISLTYNDASGTLTVASTAGGLSGTGSVDNAALRADGTGGATLQNSSWIINDNLTASPNNTVNHACLEATGGTTNVSVSIKPKGTGAFCLNPPDGSATGGNARGEYAQDLQLLRSAATQVASGYAAFVAGQQNTSSGNQGAVFGSGNSNSGVAAFVAGSTNTNSASYSILTGFQSTIVGGSANANVGSASHITGSVSGAFIAGSNGSVSANYGFAHGVYHVSNRYNQYAHGVALAGGGESQYVRLIAARKTTTAVATELFLDVSSTRLVLASGDVLSVLVRVIGVKSDGSEVIKFLRDVTLKNVGGTCTDETAATTIGTDINVSAATLDVSADNSNKTLKIAVTPPAGTWRWLAVVEGLELTYGT